MKRTLPSVAANVVCCHSSATAAFSVACSTTLLAVLRSSALASIGSAASAAWASSSWTVVSATHLAAAARTSGFSRVSRMASASLAAPACAFSGVVLMLYR